MKKQLLLLITFSAVVFSGCGLGTKKALEYNNEIVSAIDEVNKLYIELGKLMVSDKSEEDLTRVLDKIDIKCSDVLVQLDALGSFNGDDAFRQAAIDYVENTRELTNNEVRELIEIFQIIQGDEYNELDELTAMTEKSVELQKTIESEDARFVSEYQGEQQKFAERYNFKLNEDSFLQDEYDALKNEADKLNVE